MKRPPSQLPAEGIYLKVIRAAAWLALFIFDLGVLLLLQRTFGWTQGAAMKLSNLAALIAYLILTMVLGLPERLVHHISRVNPQRVYTDILPSFADEDESEEAEKLLPPYALENQTPARFRVRVWMGLACIGLGSAALLTALVLEDNSYTWYGYPVGFLLFVYGFIVLAFGFAPKFKKKDKV